MQHGATYQHRSRVRVRCVVAGLSIGVVAEQSQGRAQESELSQRSERRLHGAVVVWKGARAIEGL